MRNVYPAATLGLAALLTLTACGGAGGAARTSATPQGGDAAAAASGNNDQLVEFARCLRQNGVNVPDPKPGDRLVDVIHGTDTSGGEFREAIAACQSKLPEQARQRMNDPEMDDNMLRFAQCMRDNGVDMPDPTGGHSDFGDLDRNSPEFKKALPTCRQELTGAGSE